jgi:hypothetical protein
MSRRARITLNPEAEIETRPQRDTPSTPSPQTEAHARNRFAAAEDQAPTPSAPPAGRVLNTRAIIGAVAAGLALVSVVMLLKNRRL